MNYTEEATAGVDRLYDAQRNSVSTAQLYSYIENSKYAINSRPTFDVSDIVPLGVSRTATDAESFTIALHQPEGVFAEDEINVILHDKLLGLYHNLNQNSYVFNASELQNNERFDIVYENVTLDVNNPAYVAKANMRINKAQFDITAQTAVDTVLIYDLSGRLVQQYKIGNTKHSAPFQHAQGIYIAKAKLENGTIVTQKLINGN